MSHETARDCVLVLALIELCVSIKGDSQGECEYSE
jgi:hypothetical protein